MGHLNRAVDGADLPCQEKQGPEHSVLLNCRALALFWMT